jgi:hypothetical protein
VPFATEAVDPLVRVADQLGCVCEDTARRDQVGGDLRVLADQVLFLDRERRGLPEERFGIASLPTSCSSAARSSDTMSSSRSCKATPTRRQRGDAVGVRTRRDRTGYRQ